MKKTIVPDNSDIEMFNLKGKIVSGHSSAGLLLWNSIWDPLYTILNIHIHS